MPDWLVQIIERFQELGEEIPQWVVAQIESALEADVEGSRRFDEGVTGFHGGQDALAFVQENNPELLANLTEAGQIELRNTPVFTGTTIPAIGNAVNIPLREKLPESFDELLRMLSGGTEGFGGSAMNFLPGMPQAMWIDPRSMESDAPMHGGTSTFGETLVQHEPLHLLQPDLAALEEAIANMNPAQRQYLIDLYGPQAEFPIRGPGEMFATQGELGSLTAEQNPFREAALGSGFFQETADQIQVREDREALFQETGFSIPLGSAPPPPAEPFMSDRRARHFAERERAQVRRSTTSSNAMSNLQKRLKNVPKSGPKFPGFGNTGVQAF